MKTNIFNFFTALFLLTSFSFSQNQTTEFGVWKLMKQKDGIEIYGKHDLCLIEYASNDYHFFSVKVINTTSNEKQVSFYIKNFYVEGESGHRDENLSVVTLAPNEIIEGNCMDEDATLTRMIVNPKFENSWHYIKSEIIFESIK